MKKALLAALLLPALAQAYQPGKTYRLTVLHTNDLHGRFWPNEHGEYGLAAHQTLVKQIKNEVARNGGSVVLLNVGDVNTGVPESDVHNARPDIEAMNAIGYEAMTLGNHEFDNPLQMLAMQEKWARFPFLSANIRLKDSGRHLVKPYTVLRKQGLDIAVVGLTTEETATSANTAYTRNLIIDPAADSARQTLQTLKQRKKKPDITIALTHLGYRSDAALARILPAKSFDIIVGGHSHHTVCMDNAGRLKNNHRPGDACRPDFQNGTWIMQAGEWGKYLGRADFTFKNGKLALQSYRLIPVNLKYETETADGKTVRTLYQSAIRPDKQLAAKLKTYQEQADGKLNVAIGSVNAKLEGDRAVVRRQPTNLGRLIAHAQRLRTGADLAVMNSGGIRDSIQAGRVTYKDILRAQPFGNLISYVDLSGKELAEYLRTVALIRPEDGGFPQFDGVTLKTDYDKQQVSGILINGKPLENGKTYRLSVSDYLANGGDDYPVLSDKPSYVNTGFVDADVLKQYFEQHSPIDAARFAPEARP